MSKEDINKRFVEAVNHLLSNNIVAGKGLISESLNIKASKFSEILNYRMNVGTDLVAMISDLYNIDANWLLTGRGSMLKNEKVLLMGEQEPVKEEAFPAKKNLIPFYDDVSTIGGLNDRVANTDPNSPSEWIDAGDWFPEATAAIRHYGDSMVEYPSGSILALKRVMDPLLIMNGRNYVIKTTEYRVTKQLQDKGENFMAYSTNRETYPDGNQIHAPFPIPKEKIRYIYLVLGCVTKEYSNGAIQIRK